MDKVEYLEEQTFFNNGQFTEAEMDLMNEALNHFLQELNRRQGQLNEMPEGFIGMGHKRKVYHNALQMDAVEDLIEKLQEGS
jgi:hypothetical protein